MKKIANVLSVSCINSPFQTKSLNLSKPLSDLKNFFWQMLLNNCERLCDFVYYGKLEIKPCGLGSRNQDMKAEWRLKVITDFISWVFGK